MVQETGNKDFFWFRKIRGRRTWRTIGDCGAMSIEQARARAQEFNTKLADWKARRYEGPNPFEAPDREPTLGEILQNYCDIRLKGHAKNPDKAIKGDKAAFEKYCDAWRNKRLSSITRRQVIDLRDAIVRQVQAEPRSKKRKYDGKVTANRTISLLKRLFNWAATARDWHGQNPAARIESFPENGRERFIQPSEMPKFWVTLTTEPNRDLRDFLMLALLTAVRKSDILAMRWRNVSYETAKWTIPEPKARKPYVVTLMPQAIEVLRSREVISEFVFPARRKDGTTGHVVNLNKAWGQFRKRAGIPDVTVHDLRRTLGSWLASAGIGLPIIGAALGHRSYASTQVYARLQTDAVGDALAKVTQRMLTGKTEGT